MASVAASPVGLHCLDVTHEVLGQADAKDLWDRGQVKERRLAGWWDGGVGYWGRHMGPGQYLEEGNAHKDPSHDDQVVLQPLLKLAHAAFGVDGALLLQLLVGEGGVHTSTGFSPSATTGLISVLPPGSPCPRASRLSACCLELCRRPSNRWLLHITWVSAQMLLLREASPDRPAPIPSPLLFYFFPSS